MESKKKDHERGRRGNGMEFYPTVEADDLVIFLHLFFYG
jgi:hypothetical protein